MTWRVECADVIEWAERYEGPPFMAILADPPYSLGDGKRGFMNRDWDTDVAFNPDTWAALAEHLLPGAFIMAFASSRGWHRLAVAIEDSGLRIHPSIFGWAYGCLSEDTEILTAEGWRSCGGIKPGDLIGCFDPEDDGISYQPCSEVFVYEHGGPMVHIHGRTLDQLLTVNHKVLLKEKREHGHRLNDFRWTDWKFVGAEKLHPCRGLLLPLAGRFQGIESVGVDMAELIGWVLTDGHFGRSERVLITQSRAVNLPKVKRIRKLLQNLGLTFSEYVYERQYKGRDATNVTFGIAQASSKCILRLIPRKKPTEQLLRLVPEEMEALFAGLVGGDGLYKKDSGGRLGEFYQNDEATLDWFQRLCLHLGYKSSKNSKKGSVCWGKKSWAQIDPGWFKRKVEVVDYKGIVWCVKVPTEAFVARRNGNVFITGNSGFPKATKLDTQIDRAVGAERSKKHMPYSKDMLYRSGGQNTRPWLEKARELGYHEMDGDIPVTPLAQAWQGHRYGLQCIKPSLEPIIVAQKPYPKGKKTWESITETGAGALWIDGGRIRANWSTDPTRRGWQGGDATNSDSIFGNAGQPRVSHPNDAGRWPANFCMTHIDDRPCHRCGGQWDACPDCHGTGVVEGCKRTGTKRVKGSTEPGSISTTTLGMLDDDAWERKPTARTGYADPDGLETVDAWQCRPECPVRKLGEQVGQRSSGRMKAGTRRANRDGYAGPMPVTTSKGTVGDSGSVARFFHQSDWSYEIAERLENTDPVFYCSKAGRAERDAGLEHMPLSKGGCLDGNSGRSGQRTAGDLITPIEVPRVRNPFPTIKPISLAMWLCRLLVPPPEYAPRRLLIPFAGAGSEISAAILTGCWEEIVGIELLQEHVDIAEARCRFWQVRMQETGSSDPRVILKATSSPGQMRLF